MEGGMEELYAQDLAVTNLNSGNPNGGHSEDGKLLALRDGGFKLVVVVDGGVGGGGGLSVMSERSDAFMYACEWGKVIKHEIHVLPKQKLKVEEGDSGLDYRYVVWGSTLFVLGDNIYSVDMDAAPEEGEWELLVGPPPSTKRLDHSAICLDEKIYVFGATRDNFRMQELVWEGKHRDIIYSATSWAEVYDMKTKEWTQLDHPKGGFLECPLNPCCCVVDYKNTSSKKIILFCGPGAGGSEVFAYDPSLGVWEHDHMLMQGGVSSVNFWSLIRVLQSGMTLFFIESKWWWAYDLETKKMLGRVFNLSNIQKKLPFPTDKSQLFEVISLDCTTVCSNSTISSTSSSSDDDGDLIIHDLVLFYNVRASGDKTSYIYVARITLVQDINTEIFSAILKSLGALQLEEDCVCERAYALSLYHCPSVCH